MSLDARNYFILTPFCSFRQDDDFFNSFFLENQNQPYCSSKIYELFPDDNSQKEDYFSIINCNGDQLNQVEEEIPKITQKKVKIIKKIKKNNVQNPYRNIYSNIGNQIISFIYVKKKSRNIIKRYFKDFSVQDEEGYYRFALKIKKTINGYITQQKLKKLWLVKNLSKDQVRYLGILRKLSYYYLKNMAIQAILTSKKMSKSIVEGHFNVRRNLIKALQRLKQ